MKPPIRPGDYHLIVNDKESAFESEATLYSSDGAKLWTLPCLAKGVAGPNYKYRNADTPPGLYKLGTLTVTGDGDSQKVWNAYGRYFFDLVGLDGAEEKYNRAGCGIHGGGTGAPEPLAPYQQLMATCGCIRFHNADLENKILPVYRECLKHDATFYVTVNQF